MGSKRKTDVRDKDEESVNGGKRQKKNIENGHEPKEVQSKQDDSAVASKEKKLRPKYTEADAKLAKQLDDLASENPETRLQAAKELLTLLDPKKNKNIELTEKVLRRLIRGLCSSRKAARIGFSLVLTELLSQLYGSSKDASAGLPWNFDQLISFIIEQTTPAGEAENQERRDQLLGQAFGLKAILQSSVTLSVEQWSKVLDHAFKLAGTSPYLREHCGLMLCQALEILSGRQHAPSYLAALVEGLNSNDFIKTPEGVAVWVTIQTNFNSFELPTNVWHGQDPLCTKERQTLAKVMRGHHEESLANGSTDGEKKKTKSGYAQSTPSFAWDVVLKTVLSKKEHLKRKSGKPSEFEKFWIDIVDNNMFTSSASAERKSCGLQIFMNTLRAAPLSALSTLFSPNLMRCIINQSQEAKRNLHATAMSALKDIQARARNESASAPILIEQLLFNNGHVDFDKLTRTKTVENIMSNADDEALRGIVSHLTKLLTKPTVTEQSEADSTRRTLADMFLHIVRHRSKESFEETTSDSETSWIDNMLDSITRLSYFRPNKSTSEEDVPTPPVTDASRTILRDRLASILAHLISLGVEAVSTIAYNVVASISGLADENSMDLIFQADSEVSNNIKGAQKLLKKIDKKEKKSKKNKISGLRALKLLGSLSVLQVYNGDPDAVGILDEIKGCYESFSEQDDASSNDDNFGVLFDVLLSFSSKPSALFRNLAEQVFSAFTSKLDKESLQAMLGILDKHESLEGQQELFDQDQDMDLEEAENGEDKSIGEEDDSDVEMIEGSDVEELNGVEDSNSNEEDEEDDGDDEAADFEAKLALALGTSKPNAENEDDDDTGSTSSDSSFDDDQMMELEPALAQIFKDRAAHTQGPKRKQQRKDARLHILNFKNRVLDLLAIFLKRERRSPLGLCLPVPLVRLIRRTSSPQVAEKAYSLLHKYYESTKGKNNAPEGAPSQLLNDLRAIHDAAMSGGKNASKLYIKSCSITSLFYARLLYGQGIEHLEEVIKLYGTTYMTSLKEPEKAVPGQMFQEFANWQRSLLKR